MTTGVGKTTQGADVLASAVGAVRTWGGTEVADDPHALGVAAVAVGVLANPLGLIVAVRWITSIIMVLCLSTVVALLFRAPVAASGTA